MKSETKRKLGLVLILAPLIFLLSLLISTVTGSIWTGVIAAVIMVSMLAGTMLYHDSID